MESVFGKAREGSAMQRFSHSGKALLPLTRQILIVLWENVRLMLHVICCSLMAVFQMFRFEVHLRITDDTGEHIQHMTNARGDTEGLLLSSLFKSPLSRFNKDPFNLNTHSRSVLSSLVKDDLCCSLVDNLVSHATECLNDNEDVCAGEQFAWKHRFDWKGLESRVDEECIQSVHGKDVHEQSDCCTGLDCNLSRLTLKSQSSDSEFSWGSSDSSSIDRENCDGLWDLLRCSNDPYHPLHFTACISSAVTNKQRTQTGSSQQRNEFTSMPSSVSCCSDTSEQGNMEIFNSEDEEEALWKSLCRNDDPYHPLNFRALLNSAHTFKDSHEKSPKTSRDPRSTRCPKAFLMQRQIISHQCPQLCVEKPAKVPWKKPLNKTVDAKITKKISTLKRVKFSPIVQIHKMRAWSFALQACRKGPWEEHARDRDRFKRRIWETEQAIGYCFMQSHRDKFLIYHQSTK
ncbi:hypothetical protein Q7C36_009841 [Tachysurus vachellii]|uniref:Protein phosphatase 1 regulatory subunit 15A/B C-terminal domain-containing protein n=1 Tax=Tachysurus vachellii TaxID=175792 RepID=A0AA88SSE3_TACVA|nr:protein phosphatase 1 regulatory subunit 15B [Tachysurus vachellii]KAK2848159.1 hypothetical protein Q7C36_009841 [Tachysurus vachellii]